MKSWFLTGTDTNAGKTSAATALLLAAHRRGLRALGYKPIESGCLQGIGADAQRLASATGQQAQTSYAFPDPVAPSIAAERAGVDISLQKIQARFLALQQQTDLLITEGAGGFLVPVSARETIADLASLLAAPLLVAAPDSLGTINHTLLTLEAARRRGLVVDAVILSEREPGEGQGLDNAAQIRRHGSVSVVAMPFSSEEKLADAGDALLDVLLANTEA